MKDGHFLSAKFFSASYVGPCPHIFVFANMLLDLSSLSMDRWLLYRIKRSDLSLVRMSKKESDALYGEYNMHLANLKQIMPYRHP